MRLFLAIDLPEAQKQWLVDHRFRKEWFGFGEGFRLTRPETLHVTLNFLGEVPAERVPIIEGALSRVTLSGPIDLHVDRFTFFPPRGPIRVFVAQFGGAVDTVHELHARLEDALEALGFAREARPFTPHVTLARAEARRKPRGISRELVAKMPPPAGPRFSVDTYTLFESRLKPGGPEYVALAHFR